MSLRRKPKKTVQASRRNSSYAADIATLIAKQENIEAAMLEQKEQIAGIRKDVTEINEIANRWKGALFAILFLGGAVGGLATFASNIWKFIHG